jgi:hypothetical protein
MGQLLIAHRGNINGRIEDCENSPNYIFFALDLGYNVEVDVWLVNNKLFLGHDKPQYSTTYNFLTNTKLWLHCKNVEAMEFLSKDASLNAFAHKDDIIITRHGFLWTAPGGIITRRSIAVMPELVSDWDISEAYGICTDYPLCYER